MTTQSQSPMDPLDMRNAGAIYLSIAVFGAFSIGYVPSQIVVHGDPAATAAKLASNGGLFRLGILADSAVILLEIAITAILYHMFRISHPRLAMIAMLSRFGMIVVMGINLLFGVMAGLVFSGAVGFEPGLSQHMGQLFFDAQALGIYVWQLFFGAHLLALGAIILRSDCVPHLLGWGLFIGAFGYLVQGLAKLTFTEFALLDVFVIGLLVIVTISELSFGLWLLIVGRRRQSILSS